MMAYFNKSKYGKLSILRDFLRLNPALSKSKAVYDSCAKNQDRPAGNDEHLLFGSVQFDAARIKF